MMFFLLQRISCHAKPLSSRISGGLNGPIGTAFPSSGMSISGRKNVEDAIIVATGVVSSILCIVGYNLAADEDLLNGALLLLFGFGLFIGVAYFYGTSGSKRRLIVQTAHALREIRAASPEPSAKQRLEEKTTRPDSSDSASAPSAVPNESIPVERKTVTGTAEPENDDELATARHLVALYSQLLTEVKDPGKQKTLKRWIVQQEEIIKAKNPTAKRA